MTRRPPGFEDIAALVTASLGRREETSRLGMTLMRAGDGGDELERVDGRYLVVAAGEAQDLAGVLFSGLEVAALHCGSGEELQRVRASGVIARSLGPAQCPVCQGCRRVQLTVGELDLGQHEFFEPQPIRRADPARL